MGWLAALEDKPPNLGKILEIDQRQARPDAVGAERSQVFTVNLHIRAPAGGRRPAHAHHDHTLRHISRLKLREIQVSQLKLEIRADAIVERIAAEAVEALAPDIERRVRHHRGEPEHPGVPLRGRTVAHGLCGAQGIECGSARDKADVGIDAVDAILERFSNVRKSLVIGKHIVGVEDPDDIAGRHVDPFVDGVVHSLVGLRHPLEGEAMSMILGAEALLEVADDIDRSILGAAVDDDVLDVHALLIEDALHRGPDRRRAVVASRYERHLHLFRHPLSTRPVCSHLLGSRHRPCTPSAGITRRLSLG